MTVSTEFYEKEQTRDKIALSGDWHLDGTREQYKFVKKVMDEVDVPLILMGDMLDSGINRGMNWDQESLTVQMEQLMTILKGHVVLGYVLGNHELRIKHMTGLNPFYSLLGKEKSVYRYNGKIIVIEHGSRAPQNPLLQLTDFADIHPSAHLVALGHNHTLVVYQYNPKQILVRTGSLQLYPDYARRRIMKPKPKGYVIYDTKRNTAYYELIK